MLELKSIKKGFRTDFWKPQKLVLKDISFTLEQGAVTGFVGINGAGKTTTLNILLGLLKQDSGDVVFSDKLGTNREEIFSNIGFLPESPKLFENLTGRELLTFMGNLHNVGN